MLRRLHRQNPLARIVAVECCPENIPVLLRNTDGIATVVQATVTYDADPGREAVTFLKRVKEFVEEPSRLLFFAW